MPKIEILWTMTKEICLWGRGRRRETKREKGREGSYITIGLIF